MCIDYGWSLGRASEVDMGMWVRKWDTEDVDLTWW
jgi:hypothetical protein